MTQKEQSGSYCKNYKKKKKKPDSWSADAKQILKLRGTESDAFTVVLYCYLSVGVRMHLTDF